MEHNPFAESTILITGGTGSWGNELTTQLLSSCEPKEIRIYSRGEPRQVEMKRKFQDPRLKYYIGDVREKSRLLTAMRGVDFVFHLAALKHVPICEENAWEAAQTNIIGTQNVIESAIESRVLKVVQVSTDKAGDPFNLYGVTKACAEKLTIAANLGDHKTKFVCVRGGNVIGTSGSVIPLFREQIERLGEITVTDERMTRFFMRVKEAIQLLMKAAVDAVGGEVMVMKMPACKIVDLGAVMGKRLGGGKQTMVRSIGIRPGEKLHEVLVSRYEIPRTYDFGEYFVILPQIRIEETEAFYADKKTLKIPFEEFNSTNTRQLNDQELEELLETDGWFHNKGKQETLRYLSQLKEEDLKHFFKSEGWVQSNN